MPLYSQPAAWRRWSIATLALTLLSIGALLSCNGPRYSKPKAVAGDVPRAVRTVQPRGAASGGAAGPLTGTVAAEQSSSLAFQASGQVKSVHFELGDQVEAGQLLALLDDSLLQAQLTQAEGALGQARASLDLLRAGNRPEEVAAAQAQLDGARAAEQRLRADFERAEQLFAEGVIARAQLDQAQAALTQASKAAESAAQALAITRQGARPEQLQLAEAALTSASGGLAAARTQLEHASLRAPSSGSISMKQIEPGQVVAAGQPVCQLSSAARLEIRSTVPEGRLAQVYPGQPAQLEFPALPGLRASATVLRINAEADPATRGFPLELSLDSASVVSPPPPDSKGNTPQESPAGGAGADAPISVAEMARLGLRPGIVAIVNLELPGAPDGLSVPRRCLMEGAVFVVQDGKARRRAIEVLSSDGEDVLVSGLSPGDEVVVNGQEYLSDGESVQQVSALGIEELTRLSGDE